MNHDVWTPLFVKLFALVLSKRVVGQNIQPKLDLIAINCI
jgi:hypothetical protein